MLLCGMLCNREDMKNILVCGGGGFIGHHLARKLKNEGHYVVIADIKNPAKENNIHINNNEYDSLVVGDLTKLSVWESIEKNFGSFNEVYQLAADMGGAGYIFTGENDYNVMHNSSLINLQCVEFCLKWKAKVFYSSSACMYPSHNQEDPLNPICSESSAYPANPDSEYGWEKLFSERMYLAANRNYGLDVRIARFHNIFGPEGTWTGGKEKAPAALCRKVIEAKDTIEIWGPGTQTRSFLYIDECIEGVQRLMESNCKIPVNIGSEEMISINNLALMISDIANKPLTIKNIKGPMGVMGRNSDNTLIRQMIGWAPSRPLKEGIEKTYSWIKTQYEHQIKEHS